MGVSQLNFDFKFGILILVLTYIPSVFCLKEHFGNFGHYQLNRHKLCVLIVSDFHVGVYPRVIPRPNILTSGSQYHWTTSLSLGLQGEHRGLLFELFVHVNNQYHSMIQRKTESMKTNEKQNVFTNQICLSKF